MQVQVWDGQAGVLMDSFRQHTADVLALAASADGSSVFAAGVDGKVICLQKVLTQCYNEVQPSLTTEYVTYIGGEYG
jgi:WD40 repeat protein